MRNSDAIEGNVELNSTSTSSPRSSRANRRSNTIAERSSPIKKVKREQEYGDVPGIKAGAKWKTRVECSRAGVHTPLRQGICGGPDGAYSIVLSGGYADDVDDGDTIAYTGAGGRDAKSERVVKDQKLDAPYNKSLVLSSQTGKPVRVVRGPNPRSKYAPLSGYRYDGLYEVESVKKVTGKEGHVICTFFLRRLPGQPPIPRPNVFF